jgi:hypothetical protein
LTGWRTRPAKAGRPLFGTVAFIVRQPRSHVRQNALPGAYTGQVNELLEETEYPIPPIEFGNYRGGSAVVPAVALSFALALCTFCRVLRWFFTCMPRPGDRQCRLPRNGRRPRRLRRQ